MQSKVKVENVVSRELLQYLDDTYPRRPTSPKDELGAIQWYAGRQSLIDDLRMALGKVPHNPMLRGR